MRRGLTLGGLNLSDLNQSLSLIDDATENLSSAGEIGTASVTGIDFLLAQLSPVAVSANTTAEQTFSVMGLTYGSAVIVTKPTAQAGLGIVGARVAATNSLGITFSNNTGSPITPTAAQTYLIVAMRSA